MGARSGWRRTERTSSNLTAGLLNGGIFQTFATTIGQSYLVRFDVSGNPGDAPSNGFPRVKEMRVNVGDVSRDFEFDSTGLTTITLVWEPVSFAFVATGTTETLSFTSLTPFANSYGALIDNVSVTAVAVPELSTLILLGVGLTMLARAQGRKSLSEN